MYTTLFRPAFRGEMGGEDLPPPLPCNINPAQQISFVVKYFSVNVKIFLGKHTPIFWQILVLPPLGNFLNAALLFKLGNIALMNTRTNLGYVLKATGCLEKAETDLTVFQMIPCTH